MGAKRRNYDDEFKPAAIRLVKSHGVSETARNLGINANMLSRWKRKDEAKQNDMSTDAGLSSQEKEELRQLSREVKWLRREREILNHSVLCQRVELSYAFIAGHQQKASPSTCPALLPCNARFYK